MSKSDVEDDCGVSFKGKGRKFDDENDCKDLIDAIKACKKLEYLNLEGNSVGVQAAQIISKALAEHPELKRAIWKDMFTGRMKTEIPKALEYLGSGLNLAGAQLTELDLSDNAFGPIGVEGLAGLLASESCYSLKELRLNNNGLGISGGKMLAKALLQCHANSAAAGKALALKTLIAGRNRLENDGAKALSEVFQTLGTLEEISMPQNGIYHPGIAALSQALTKNPNLKILNLNDNTLTEKGATSIANVLPHLQKLKSLNLGDCLLRTGGATVLANALADQHLDLEELNLDNNEIKIAGGLAVAKAMGNKERLKELLINGNNFGESGKVLLKKELEKGSKLESLGTLSDDESECDDDDEEGQGDQESEEEDQEDSEKEDSKIEMFNNINSNNKINNQDSQLSNLLENLQVSGQDDNTDAIANLLKDTAALERLIGMDDGKINEFLENNKNPSTEFYLNSYIPFLMKISSLSNSGVDTAKSKVLEISLALYRRLFSWASQNGQIAAVNNALFVYLGLIKSEDKSFKINWDINGCVSVLKSAIDAGIIPDTTKQILTCCLERKISKS